MAVVDYFSSHAGRAAALWQEGCLTMKSVVWSRLKGFGKVKKVLGGSGFENAEGSGDGKANRPGPRGRGRW